MPMNSLDPTHASYSLVQEIQHLQKDDQDLCLPDQVFWHATCESTNSELANILKQNPSLMTSPHICVSNSQTNGRGQHQRSWHSHEGNLFFSCYVPITEQAQQDNTIATIALEIAVALMNTPTLQQIPARKADSVDAVKIGIKWPNDLVVQFTKSEHAPLQKYAGILVEPVYHQSNMMQLPRMPGVIIGIGINANADVHIIDNRPITNLQRITGNEIDLVKLASECYQACIHGVKNHAQHNNNLANRYAMFDILHGKAVHVALSNQEQDNTTTLQRAITGRCIGINQQGALLVQSIHNSVHTLYSGRVSLLQPTNQSNYEN